MLWWIASWAEDEQYKGKYRLLRRGVLVLGGCEDGLDLVQDEMAEAPSPLSSYCGG